MNVGLIKVKYGDNGKFCYIDTDNFITDPETIDIFEDVKDDVEETFYTSDYEVKRPLTLGKNRKVISMTEDQNVGKVIKQFVSLRPKMYSSLKEKAKNQEWLTEQQNVS